MSSPNEHGPRGREPGRGGSAAESQALHERVRCFIRDSLAGAPRGSFDALACDMARFQARHIEPIRRAFDVAGVDPDRLDDAAHIPALPAEVFRLRRIAAHPDREDRRVFRTSGTTLPTRGAHYFRTTDSYEAAAVSWAARMLWPDGAKLTLVLLAGDETSAPESSLSFMLARFAQAHGSASWHARGERVDVAAMLRAITRARADGRPVLLAGASFAFVRLCDSRSELGGSLELPRASRVMHTGGLKGRSREVDAAVLRHNIAELFAVPQAHVVAEYGMTELSSQAYQATLAHALGTRSAPASATAYYPPPWLRFACVDPISLVPTDLEQEGICRVVDLANVDSAVAIQTADRVVLHADGSIELFGRLAGAAPRGCSLAVEHLLGGSPVVGLDFRDPDGHEVE